jgi:hypothetical protein
VNAGFRHRIVYARAMRPNIFHFLAAAAAALPPAIALADVVPFGRTESPEERAARIASRMARDKDRVIYSTGSSPVAVLLSIAGAGLFVYGIARVIQSWRTKDDAVKKVFRRDAGIFLPAGLCLFGMPLPAHNMPSVMLAAFVSTIALVVFFKLKKN